MKNHMFFLILLSIFLGILSGIFYPEETLTIRWIGQVFINLLKLIVLPLIFCALVSAIASIGSMKKLGSIGGYTLAYVLLSVSIAVTIGLVLLNVFKLRSQRLVPWQRYQSLSWSQKIRKLMMTLQNLFYRLQQQLI